MEWLNDRGMDSVCYTCSGAIRIFVYAFPLCHTFNNRLITNKALFFLEGLHPAFAGCSLKFPSLKCSMAWEYLPSHFRLSMAISHCSCR